MFSYLNYLPVWEGGSSWSTSPVVTREATMMRPRGTPSITRLTQSPSRQLNNFPQAKSSFPPRPWERNACLEIGSFHCSFIISMEDLKNQKEICHEDQLGTKLPPKVFSTSSVDRYYLKFPQKKSNRLNVCSCRITISLILFVFGRYIYIYFPPPLYKKNISHDCEWPSNHLS